MARTRKSGPPAWWFLLDRQGPWANVRPRVSRPLAGALVVTGAGLLAACDADIGPPDRLTPEASRYVLEADFIPEGVELVAHRSSEGLCLEATTAPDASGSGACGFSDRPSGGRYATGGMDDGFLYAYGPVPLSTRTVRISLDNGASIESATGDLPASVARGRFFYAGLGKDVVIESVSLFDGSGAPVQPQDF